MKEAKVKYTRYMMEVQKTGGTSSSTPNKPPLNNSIIQGAYDVGAEEIQKEILSSGYLTKKKGMHSEDQKEEENKNDDLDFQKFGLSNVKYDPIFK